MRVDVAILTETKFTNDCHTHQSASFQIAPGIPCQINQGGVALEHHTKESGKRGWHLEEFTAIGVSVRATTIVTGQQIIRDFGIYLPPGDNIAIVGPILDDLSKALQEAGQRQQPNGTKPNIIVAGGFNSGLMSPQNERDHHVVSTLAHYNISPTNRHFIMRGNNATWRGMRNSRTFWSCIDFICASNARQLVSRVAAFIPEGFTSNHKLVKGRIPLATAQEIAKHSKVLHRQKKCHPMTLTASDIRLERLERAA